MRPLLACLLACCLTAAEGPVVRDVDIAGTISGATIRVIVTLTAEAKAGQVLPVAAGDLVLDRLEAGRDHRVLHDGTGYAVSWSTSGTRTVRAEFLARARAGEDGLLTAAFTVPSTAMRSIAVAADRADLDLRFPGALRVRRETVDGTLRATAVLGPDLPFAVAWKPQVARLDGELVLSADANTIARVVPGALRLDSVHRYEIAQGRLERLRLGVPAGVEILQVRGEHLLDWRVAEEDGRRVLAVALNRPLEGTYLLQIVAELPLPALPQTVEVPRLEPLGVVRATGALAVGTDAAIAVVPDRPAGLSQVDAAAFPALALAGAQRMALPAKAFHYLHAAGWSLRLQLADVVPTWDVEHRLAATLAEDDAAIDAALEVEVRDAPVRELRVRIPAGWSVARIAGGGVDEDASAVRSEDGRQVAVVAFSKPVLGRTLVQLRLELGASPLERALTLGGLEVVGARSERGHLVLGGAAGIDVQPGTAEGLRPVHPGSLPERVAEARAAWRFRGPWSLAVRAARRQAGVRAEAMHLISLGDGAAYGVLAVNYVITGAPVDELHFAVPAALRNVEFVGTDIAAKKQDGERWTVRLKRRIAGDYNLALAWRQDLAGGALVAGAIACARVETETGWVVVSSRQNLRVEPRGELPPGLLEVAREELPANLRLLVTQPVLRAWKLVGAQHAAELAVDAFPAAPGLQAVVEVLTLKSDLSLREDGRPESVTRARYAVKNATGQFLALSLPAGARLWAATLIEGGDGDERRERLTATVDGDLLKLPLRRHADPNRPTVIEVEYGLVHEVPPWSGRIALAAPVAPDVRTTFTGWSVAAPAGWAVLPAADAGAAEPPPARERPGVAEAVARAGEGWGRALALAVRAWPVALLVAAVVGALALVRRRLPPFALLGAVILFAFGTVAALVAPGGGEAAPREALFQQVLALDGGSGVVAHVVPAWRAGVGLDQLLVAPLIALAALIGTVLWRRARPVLAALTAAAAAHALAALPMGAALLVQLLTWAIPLALLVVLVRRLLPLRPPMPAGAAGTASLLLALALLAGCGGGPARDEAPAVERLEAVLTVEEDVVVADLALTVVAGAPGVLPLLEPGALVPEPPKDAAFAVERADGAHRLRIVRAGRHTVRIRALLPLAADRVGGGAFALPLPCRALATHATLVLPRGGFAVASEGGVGLAQADADGRTTATALFAPGAAADFAWSPRARDTASERASVYAEVATLARFDAGLAEGRHLVRLRVAQGEVRAVAMGWPAGISVGAVEGLGAQVATWRFDPAARRLEARLAAPATGEFTLLVTTRALVAGTPFTAPAAVPAVEGVEHQRSALVLAHTAAVALAVQGPAPAALDPQDVLREAPPLRTADLLAGATIRQAWRADPAKPVAVEAAEVRPELRVREASLFSIADDRLVLAGTLTIDVAKAGVFGLELALPEGFDVDALACEGLSHWDDLAAEVGARRVGVRFTARTQGTVALKLALSRPVDELGERLAVPRIGVVGALSHGGTVAIAPERGVRLAFLRREGVGEFDAGEVGVRAEGALAVRLLRPDWTVELGVEAVRPLITVDQLHQARVAEGLVRHTVRLRLRLAHAGARAFEITVPEDGRGLTVEGPEIAGWRETGRAGGLRTIRIELARKWFDRPYPLQLGYETGFDRERGRFVVHGVAVLGADLQRGHVVVHGSDRVELAAPQPGKGLQEAQARAIPRDLGGDDLADAAFCYAATGGDWALELGAVRHAAANPLEARVESVAVDTVATVRGDTLNRVRMRLAVGAQRNLRVRLPAGAEAWTAAVDRRPVVPAREADALLIPFAQAGAGEVAVEVEFVYAVVGGAGLRGRVALTGPRFDLPLRDVRWTLWLPEGVTVAEVGGTLALDPATAGRGAHARFDLAAYEQELRRSAEEDRRRALELQARGREFAANGAQYEARQALQSAWNYSSGDAALNEDARVQLNRLNQQQAVVGLVGRRDGLRKVAGAAPSGNGDLGDRFTAADAERLSATLAKDDLDNLRLITGCLVEYQELADAPAAQLAVTVPVRGRRLDFVRALQVEPEAEMTLRFTASVERRAAPAWPWLLGVGALVLALIAVLRVLARRPAAPTPAPIPTAPTSTDPWQGV